MLASLPVPMPPEVEGVRILGFCDCYSPTASGGAERAAWQVYRRLGAAGSVVHVVSAAHGIPHRDPNVAVEVIRGLDLSRFAGGYFAPAPAAFVAAKRAHKRFKPDVIHVNTLHYTGCLAGAWLAARTGVPLIVTVQLGPLDHLPGVTKRLAAAYERLMGGYILRRAQRVLAVSETARTHAIDLGAPPDLVELAPNGVDREQFKMPPLVARPTPLIVAVGRLTGNKGPDLLLEAAGALDRGLPFRLAFVGDGPMRAQLEQRVAALRLTDRVEFPGQVDDVARWMEAADIVVRSSYTEGLALAVIEGMAAGRCNIVSDIPPNLELIRDGENGLTFRSGKAKDLARVLHTALTDEPLRERLGRQAEIDARPFTWDNMASTHGAAMLDCAADARP